MLNRDPPNHLKSGHAIMPIGEWGVLVHNRKVRGQVQVGRHLLMWCKL